MAARTENELPAIETHIAASAPRLTWVRPEVRRMTAGSAEQGGSTLTDLGVNQS